MQLTCSPSYLPLRVSNSNITEWKNNPNINWLIDNWRYFKSLVQTSSWELDSNWWKDKCVSYKGIQRTHWSFSILSNLKISQWELRNMMFNTRSIRAIMSNNSYCHVRAFFPANFSASLTTKTHFTLHKLYSRIDYNSLQVGLYTADSTFLCRHCTPPWSSWLYNSLFINYVIIAIFCVAIKRLGVRTIVLHPWPYSVQICR